ncbi:3-keto-disaccharide hydrolase [Polaribacter sp. M15]
MKNSFLIIVVIFTLACKKEKEEIVGKSKSNPPKGWIALFNGKNLDNWSFFTRDATYQGTINDIFKVENGIIHVYPTQKHNSTQTFAGIITKKKYKNYSLQLEYKWGENKFAPRNNFVRDAGVLFHVFGNNIIWPNSVECQIQEGDTGDVWAINTQVSSKVNSVIRNYSKKGDTITRGGYGKGKFNRFHRGYDWEKPHGQWNFLEIEVIEDNALFKLNGKVVNEAINMKRWDTELKKMIPLIEGKILLQAEGAELYYKNVFLKEY